MLLAGYTGQLMDAYNAYAAPNDLMYRAGANKDDFSQRLLNDDIRLFDDRNNKPLERQSMYNALYSGAGQLGGTQTQKQSSGGGEIAGGLLSLLGLF